MGRVVLLASNESHVQSLVAYVEMQKPERLYGWRAENDNELVIRPKVQSRVDSVRVLGVTDAVWNALKPRLNGVSVLSALHFEFSEDRAGFV